MYEWLSCVFILQVQREGMRLFLIWYQVLMDNATEECHATYKSLVPQLGSTEGVNTDIFTSRPSLNSKFTHKLIDFSKRPFVYSPVNSFR